MLANETGIIGSSVKTILFDLGGVIFDLSRSRAIESFRKLGLDQIDTLMGYSHHSGVFAQFEQGSIGVDQFCDQIRAMSRPENTNEQICNAFGDILVDIPQSKIRLIKELQELGYELYALSNNNPACYKRMCDVAFAHDVDIVAQFRKVYLSCDLKMLKPDPEIFKAVIRDSGIDPSATLFIDDSAESTRIAQEQGFNVFNPETNSDFTDLILAGLR